MIIDFDLRFLQDAANLVDTRLDILDKMIASNPDPDSYGIYDELEYITGFGFVACQAYISATIGRLRMKKQQALNHGPRHKTGNSYVSLVNACANHWKHSAEWDDQALHQDARRTIETISSLGVNTAGAYPIANTLHHLLTPHSARFSLVLPFLVQWREAVQRLQRGQPP